MYSRTRGRSAGRRGYSRSSDRLHAPLGQLPVAWGANRFVRISPIRELWEEALTTRPSAAYRARFGLLLTSCGFPASTAGRGIRRLGLDSEARPLAHGVDELWPDGAACAGAASDHRGGVRSDVRRRPPLPFRLPRP